MITQISIQEALQKKNAIFIDTRTPKEFEEDHLPSAINVPILSNEERVVVGTLYKQVSQDIGIEKGIEFFKKKLPSILKSIEPYKEKALVIYCWRGGMRSKTVAAILESLNYNVFQMNGGYKEYRRWVMDKIASYKIKPKLIVLYGLTCSGKTELLQRFPNKIDLEALAGHRGSMYGGIGISQKTQKYFENNLLQQLERLKNEKYILVEGESKRIGNVFIPEFFFSAMEHGIMVLVERSLRERVTACVSEYLNTKENVEKFRNITTLIRKNMSNKTRESIIKNIDTGLYEEAVKILLEDYYDPLYNFSLEKKEYSLVINTDNMRKAEEDIKEFMA